MHVLVATEDSQLLGGVTYELYPQSRCGFVTYLVVAPGARANGLGRRLFETAAAELYAAGARAVFAEVNDPRVHGDPARPRLARFERWGARVLDVPYVQPSLGEGLPRDEGLCLIVLPPVPEVTSELVASFVRELYQLTEGALPPE
jgi:hypothetical protein